MLDELDMTPVFAIFETDTWMALSTSKDPETELRMFKSRNARVTGIAFTLYAANEVFGRRVVSQTARLLEVQGVRVDGRWVGASVDQLQTALFEVSRSMGAKLLTAEERLQVAVGRVKAREKRAGLK